MASSPRDSGVKSLSSMSAPRTIAASQRGAGSVSLYLVKMASNALSSSVSKLDIRYVKWDRILSLRNSHHLVRSGSESTKFFMSHGQATQSTFGHTG